MNQVREFRCFKFLLDFQSSYSGSLWKYTFPKGLYSSVEPFSKYNESLPLKIFIWQLLKWTGLTDRLKIDTVGNGGLYSLNRNLILYLFTYFTIVNVATVATVYSRVDMVVFDWT